MLKVASIPTLTLNQFSSLADLKANTLAIGTAIGKQAEAAALNKSFDLSLQQLKKRCRWQGKTFINYSDDGTFFGQGTTFDDMFTQLGGDNIATKLGIKGWAKMSTERLALLKPDFIIATGELGERARIKKRLQATVGWRSQKPSKQRRLLLVPGRYLYSVTHHVATALEIACAQSQ